MDEINNKVKAVERMAIRLSRKKGPRDDWFGI